MATIQWCPRSRGSSSFEAIDERRTVLVQERDETDGALLRVAVGKGERPGADVLAAQRFVAPLRGLDHLVAQRLQVVLHAAERRLRGAFERRIERRNRSMTACIDVSIAARRSPNDSSTAGGICDSSSSFSADFVLRLQRLERQLVFRRGTASPPNRPASPTRADTSAASARRSARRRRAVGRGRPVRSGRRRSRSSGTACPARSGGAARSG